MATMSAPRALLALVLVALALCQVRGQTGKPKEVTQCQTELAVTDDDVMEYMDKDIPFNTKMKCFVKCLGEKFGIFKDGQIVESKILTDIKKNSKDSPANFDKEMKVYNECKDKKGSDACETAGLIYKCVRSASASWMKTK